MPPSARVLSDTCPGCKESMPTHCIQQKRCQPDAHIRLDYLSFPRDARCLRPRPRCLSADRLSRPPPHPSVIASHPPVYNRLGHCLSLWWLLAPIPLGVSNGIDYIRNISRRPAIQKPKIFRRFLRKIFCIPLSRGPWG